MAMLDIFFKPIPNYEPDNDPLATPGDDEKHDLGLHVKLCALRYSDLKQGHVEIAQQLQSTQKLIAILIVVLLMNKAIDVSMFTGWLQ